MSRREKRLAALRQNPRGVRFEELAAVLRASGFIQRQSAGGSHVVFQHEQLSCHLSVPNPGHGPVRAAYVIQALDAIEELEKQGG